MRRRPAPYWLSLPAAPASRALVLQELLQLGHVEVGARAEEHRGGAGDVG